jgi:hypothetical protein
LSPKYLNERDHRGLITVPVVPPLRGRVTGNLCGLLPRQREGRRRKHGFWAAEEGF